MVILGKSYKKNEVRSVDKGVRYEVIPFKNKKDIEKIKQYLLGKKNKRDYALFVLGINAGLRTQDLVLMKVSCVSSSRTSIHRVIQIIEKKTGKIRAFELNDAAVSALRIYLNSLPEYNPDSWLFPSRKSNIGDGHLTVDAVRRIIKDFCRELNIQGNFGAHSLRKTFGYWVYISGVQKNPLILVTLQRMFNHNSQTTTMRYIGIESSEISNIYRNLNI